MEIDKEENIIVRYIPQYIVVETRYEQYVDVDPQPISKIVHNVKHENEILIGSEDLFQDEQFEQYNALDDDTTEDVEFKQDNAADQTDNGVCSKQSPTKRTYNSKSTRLLNEWFMSNLLVRLSIYKFRTTRDKFFPKIYVSESVP